MIKKNFIFILIAILYVNCRTNSLKNLLFSSEESETPKTYVFGHKNPDTDAIASAILEAYFEEKIGNENQVIPCRLGEINKETKYVLEKFDFDTPILITNSSDADEVILVDHNEPSQSTDDISESNVVKVIDHHGLTGFRSDSPIYVLTKPVGCTCTILYKLFKIYDVKITKKIAGLMMSAIISDTVLLKSAITTEEDKETVKTLSEIAEITDYEDYGLKMLIAGTDVSDYTEKQIINLDLKTYKVSGYKIHIAFLNSVDVDSIIARKENILKEMENHIEENKSQLFVFNILDIINLDSTVLVEGKFSNAVEKAFNVTLKDNQAFLPGITSRKKEVYPYIANQIEKLYPNSYSSKIKINMLMIIALIFMIL